MERLSPGRILAAIGRGFRAVGRVVASSGRFLVRLPGAIWAGLSDFWRSLSLVTRRRLAAALAAAAAAVLFFALAVPNLPCQFPGGDFCAAEDEAEDLVPAEALAYMRVNVDPDDEDYQRAAEVRERLPVLGGQIVDRVLSRLPKPSGTPLDFDEDVRPWLGGEVALAALPRSGGTSFVTLLEVDDGEGAEEFAGRLSEGVPHTEELEGIELSVGDDGTASARVHGFLAIGDRDGVREVVTTASGAGDGEDLGADEDATRVRDELPDHRFAEAYVSEDGVGELLDRQSGLDALAPLVAPGATRGAAAALTATEEGDLELAVRSALDPKEAKAQPGFFAAFPRFEPELPERLPADSLAYVGIGEPRSAVSALVSQAGREAPGVAAAFEGLVEGLSEQVDLRGELLDSLGDEAAFSLEPRPADGGPQLPFLQFLASGVDEEEARSALAELQGPLAASVNPGSAGAAPVFSQQEIEGVEAQSLQISPTVELTYAIFDALAVIATDPEGVAQLARDEGGLEGSDRYERATEDFDDEVSLLAYLDLEQLVKLGERLGLAEDPLYATFASDFRRLEALGFEVAAGDELLVTDARLLLGN
jgi:hypothetical protein